MKYKINRDWLFYPSAGSNDMLTKEFDDNYWRQLDLPHDWSIEGEFDKKNYRSAILHEGHLEARNDSFLPRGEGIYRKKLQLPPEAKNSAVFLEFDGVFGESYLYVNGKKVGENLSGYTGKLYDITSFAANNDELTLAMRVNANRMQGWWYEGAGIYRHVHLIVVPRCYMDEWGVYVNTPDITSENAKVCVSSEIVNSLAKDIDAELELEIFSPDGTKCNSASQKIKISSNSMANPQFSLDIAAPELWDIDSPNLYNAMLTLKSEAGTQIKKTSFGIRSFYFTPDKGFFLNGRQLQLRGGNLHHDFGALGTALPDRAHEKNVEVVKEMGANILRSSHNPAAVALMDACDKLGMLLWAETRNMYPDYGGREDLTALIRRDRNHPSIICWSLANTAGAKDGKTFLTENLKELHDLARKTDPYRPTAIALEGNADFNANGFACVTDLVGYNGGGMEMDVRDHENFPDRCIAISEYSSGRGARGVYEKKVLGEVFTERLGDGRIAYRDGKRSTEQELLAAHAKEWSHVERNPFLAGGLMWSIIEYRGETSGFPIVTSQFGVFDICRFPKDSYYYYRMMWRDEPLVHLFPPWKRDVAEGTPVELYCLSNCEEIEISLNGEVIKKERVNFNAKSPEPWLKWQIPYYQGTLKVRGFNNNKEVCCKELTTFGEPDRLRISADRTELVSGGEDIAFLRIDVLDQADNFVADAAVKLQIKVEGAGHLLGLASGDPASHEQEKSDTITTFNGSALAVVKTINTEGDILVTVSCGSLKNAQIVLKSICCNTNHR